MKRLWLIPILVALLARPALAAEAGGLSVAPSLEDIVLKPDQPQFEYNLYLGNSTKGELPLDLSVVDFGALDESGGIAFLGADNNLERHYGLASWVELEKDSLTLAPGETQTVKVKVVNKQSLAPGGHYGAVLIKVSNGQLGEANQPRVALNQVFSALMLVKKLGGEVYQMDLSSIDRNGGWWGLPNLVKVRLHNSGNVHMAPKGNIVIQDPAGRVVAIGTINPENSRLLPETFRVFPTKLKQTAPIFLIGRYTMQVSYGYDQQLVLKNTKQTFYVVNLLGIALLLLVVGVIYAAWRWRRQLIRHAKKAARQIRKSQHKKY